MGSIEDIRRLTGPLMAATQDGGHVPDVLARYFRAGDDGTVVWWMTHGVPVRETSPFLRGSFDFRDGSAGIVVADLFDGREPQRVDAHAAQGGEATIPFRIELMLDSQLAGRLG